jgi:hypothetical protein
MADVEALRRHSAMGLAKCQEYQDLQHNVYLLQVLMFSGALKEACRL